MRAYLYIVTASKDPDSITCKVPYEIDEDEIFFGPCKKRLREQLRREFLRDKDSAEPKEEIFLVGFNGSNNKQVRKIVWAGRIKRLMTFRCAGTELAGKRYQTMVEDPATPLHLRARSDGKPGYEHRGDLHAGDWLADLVSDPSARGIHAEPRKVGVEGASSEAVLTRDLCVLLDNIYFAGGCSAGGAGGIPLDEGMVRFLGGVQRRDDVDAYRVFGRRSDGSAEGLTGRWWLLRDDDARQFMDMLRARLPTARVLPRAKAMPERETSAARSKAAGGRKC